MQNMPKEVILQDMQFHDNESKSILPFELLRVIAVFVPLTMRSASLTCCRWVPPTNSMCTRAEFLRSLNPSVRSTTAAMKYYYGCDRVPTAPSVTDQVPLPFYTSRCASRCTAIASSTAMRCKRYGIWQEWRACWHHRHSRLPLIMSPTFTFSKTLKG